MTLMTSRVRWLLIKLNQYAVTSAIGRLRQEDGEFKARLHSEFQASLAHVRPCLKNPQQGRGVAQLAECLLPSQHIQKLHMMVHAGNPSIQEIETGGSGVQSHPWLDTESEASLGQRPCPKKEKQNKTKNNQARPGSAQP